MPDDALNGYWVELYKTPKLIEQARPALERHGFTIDAASCATYRAYVGHGVFPYQWCGITHR